MSEAENVVLVNREDEVLGLMEKQEAHVAGLLHRAFSVFVFNNENQLLIQKRAEDKYHSPGLWTNTCCSHPREGETYAEGASRRLQEEMGFECPLEYVFDFIYKADVGDGLTEHELDYVFRGTFNGSPVVNRNEVSEYKWIDFEELKLDVEENPDKYTRWFQIIFKEYLDHL